MAEISSNSKRIAKNTMALYIRMLLSIVVSLYTSRVVLQTLGVEDYGIYGVVGGVVAMFSFLNAAMSGATSRFLTFEMGKAKKDESSTESIIKSINYDSTSFTTSAPSSITLSLLQKTFSSAMIIHIGIALIVFVLAISIGLWFLNNKLVITEVRMTAAYWVYFCSILGMFVSVTQVPYNAAIIAHEKMDVYAYVELLNVFLKLGIVYLLLIGNFDKLILYAFLMLGVNVIVAVTYRIYCLKHYEETHFHFVFEKDILKPMLSFTGWDLLGHFGFSFRTQGANMIINMFFGATVNAAGSLASTVQSILFNFSSNVITAIKPQIIKRYSTGDYTGMSSLIYSGIKMSLLMMILMTLPMIVNIEFILKLWLKDVPEHTVAFCNIMLWANVVSAVSQIIYCGIQATGDLKKTSIIRNIVYIGTPFVIYGVFCYDNHTPVWAYIVILLSQVILALCDMAILTSKLTFVNIMKIVGICAKVFVVAAFSTLLSCWVASLFANLWLRLVTSSATSTILILLSFYYIVFVDCERNMANKYLINIKNRIVK